MVQFELQPTLKNDLVILRPLQEGDFERLFSIASDPLIWEQHPKKDRYKREVFESFFQEAMESGGAFLFLDAHSNEVIGSSRYYEFSANDRSVAIGYTFLARQYWGKAYNSAIKSLMLNHAFSFVDRVIFHVGVYNKRSQIAVEKLGANRTGVNSESFAYELSASTWYSPQINHIALWTNHLEKMRNFYCEFFKGQSSSKYVNEKTGFESYFISFKHGPRLELMSQKSSGHMIQPKDRIGWAHLAFSFGSKEKVDWFTKNLKHNGFTVVSGPRITGDGYYESCVLDPDGNEIEITI